MIKDISCCGRICSECKFYKKECYGCSDSRGMAPWVEKTDFNYCPINSCFRNQCNFESCNDCDEFPCKLYNEFRGIKSDISDEEYANDIELRKTVLENEVPHSFDPFK